MRYALLCWQELIVTVLVNIVRVKEVVLSEAHSIYLM